ncbi:MAG: hypothetical protein JNM83_17260 [Myxococcales bacterium]|nr:hypothetical protein [Myxococcales bacterium]
MMRSHLLRPSLALLLLGAACSDNPAVEMPSSDAGTSDLAMTAVSDGGTDNSAAGLTAFVKAGSYKSWKAEPAIHASTGPHGGNVRTYVNSLLYASLKAGNVSHPKGSIVVKELYGSGTTTLTHKH